MAAERGASHPSVKELRRLVAKRRERRDSGRCVLEGPDLVEAALDAGVQMETLFVDAEKQEEVLVAALMARASRAGVDVVTLGRRVFESVAESATPQSVLATVTWSPASLVNLPEGGCIVVLHEIRDPGNAGTIIRSAEASGASAVIFTGDSVDPTNPKTLRATAGAIFAIPVVVADRDETFERFRSRNVPVLAALAHGGADPLDSGLAGDVCVVFGNESSGLDAETVAGCDGSLTIVTPGRSESLSVAAAATVIVFEALRQRRATETAAKPSSL